MAYYIRVLSPSEDVASIGKIRERLRADKFDAQLDLDGDEGHWQRLVVAHSDQMEICVIERNSVTPGELGASEIDEFLEEIGNCSPASAVLWLSSYLSKVKTIYAIQVLFKGAEHDNGWDIIGEVKEAILNDVSGIIQADNEGFTNEDGYHILWQFSDSVKGPWWMAVLEDEKWVRFQMELGDNFQRAFFLRGEVPPGAEVRA